MDRKTPLWSLLTCMNGGLAGMVASCAACDNMHNASAIAVGFFAGITYFWLSNLAIKCGIDDPLGKGNQILLKIFITENIPNSNKPGIKIQSLSLGILIPGKF